MISYLKVRNLAIVEEFEVELGPGFNVLTGETGAGKSLLIDSLEFLSGARSSTESIRAGEEKMTAEAIFAIDPSSDAAETVLRNESGELVVRREFGTNGRGRATIDGDLVTVRELQLAMSRLIEIHGQNESHQLIAGQSFREILDAFAGNEIALEGVRQAWREWETASAQMTRLSEAQRDRTLKIDLLRYQIQELSAAKLDAAEEESLRAERAILGNAQALIAATATSLALLDEDEESALTRIGRALHALHSLRDSITELSQIGSELEDVRYRLQESVRSLADFASDVRHDPERLEWIEERLETIDRLKKKYGPTIQDALAHLARIEEEAEQLSDFEGNLAKLQKQEAERFALYREAAEQLSGKRKAGAERFQTAIQSELRDLAMEGTTVRIAVSTTKEEGSRFRIADQSVSFGPDGIDRVEILIAPNRGEEPKPMQKIASGGELSRIQLAIAAALFKSHDGTAAATLVFDEIDAGVGGRVAEVVGRKLRELAKRNQVVCVTHLPQIASLGTTHFRVWKEEKSGRTRARILRLDRHEDRVDEIARMLGGAAITESARAHAQELLGASDTPPKPRRKSLVG